MSEVKVNKISPRTDCGTTQLGDAGDTITVTGDLKSNSLKPATGTTLTLGQSGDTVTLASGASQSGFGRTGTVDWDTTPKTATFTAVSGDGFFCNTTSGGFTCNLPAGAAGAIVSLADYAGTWQTNNLTVSPNGSEKIGGTNANVVLNTEGQSVTFIYVDSTQGWVNVQDSTSNERGNPFIVATGGTITTCGNDKIHTFTGPGTFCVTNVAACATQNIVSYVIAASGGGAGGTIGSGGAGGSSGAGAGGYREVKNPVTPYTASPLDGYSTPANRVTITAQAYPIVVGGGGAGGPGSATPNIPGNNGANGNVSSFGGISSAGGGGGMAGPCASQNGVPGGSGSGAAGGSPSCRVGGTGNTPPTTPSQGNNGGDGTPNFTGAGGGGAGGVGTNAGPGPGGPRFPGGAGVASSITGSPVTRSAGGYGKNYANPEAASNQPDNSGNGGDGALGHPSGDNRPGGNGGSGIVIIRYKFQ